MENKNERKTFKKIFLYTLLISAPLILLDAFFILSGEGGIKVNDHEFVGLAGFVIQILLIPLFAFGIAASIWMVSFLIRSISK